MKQPCVYILASPRERTLYVGVTSDLQLRTWQHRAHLVEGFSKQYHATRLVWYELHERMESAILREKAIRSWEREGKIDLVEKDNPGWADLYERLF